MKILHTSQKINLIVVLGLGYLIMEIHISSACKRSEHACFTCVHHDRRIHVQYSIFIVFATKHKKNIFDKALSMVATLSC